MIERCSTRSATESLVRSETLDILLMDDTLIESNLKTRFVKTVPPIYIIEINANNNSSIKSKNFSVVVKYLIVRCGDL